jgi:23S rRNA (cytosine1962-C5)-methyltransferase
MAGLFIKPRSRILHGHEWVYASEVLKNFGTPQDGDVISLKDSADRFLGSAIYNSKSQIIARRFCRQRQDLDIDFFQRRIRMAVEYRVRRGIAPNPSRLVWSESDGLPGLIVDRYGDNLVIQTLTLGMDQRKDLIVKTLVEILKPTSILERNDSSMRKAEGLPLVNSLLYGNAPSPFQIPVHGLQFEVDLFTGQKTGFYLDQLDAYPLVAAHAQGRKVLDCFSNQGAFALSCAQAGASSVLAVEISKECVAQIRCNAAHNQLRVDVLEANVFDALKDLERTQTSFDLIILDPPSFTKSKGRLHDALRGYKEIHLRALRLLSPDGLLATFCCSHHVSAQIFRQVIQEAAVDAKTTLRLLQSFSQRLDHPILSSIPETEYLTGALFEKVPGR